MRRAASSKACHTHLSAAKLKPIAGYKYRAVSLTSSWHFMCQIMFLRAPLPAPEIGRNESHCTPARMCSCYHTSCLGPKGQNKASAQESPARTICCSSIPKYSQFCIGQLLQLCYCSLLMVFPRHLHPGASCEDNPGGKVECWPPKPHEAAGSKAGTCKCTITEELQTAVAAKEGWKLEGKMLCTLEMKPPPSCLK